MSCRAVLAVGLLSAAGVHGAPRDGGPCTGQEDLLAIRGKWTTRADVGGSGIPAGDRAEVKARLDRIAKLFLSAYPEPRGVEAAWYRALDARPLLRSQHAYGFQSLYLEWACNPGVHRMLLGDETGTWAYAFVNHLGWFADQQKELTVEGHPTYFLTRRSGEFGGLPAYEGIHTQSSNTGASFSRAILVTRPGSSALLPVTRKEFLEAYLGAVEARIAPLIANIEKSSTDPTRKATAVAQRREQIAHLQQRARVRLASLSPAEAGEPALLTYGDLFDFKDFATEERGGRALVRLDRRYFEAKVPAYVPRFAVVYWRWQRSVPSEAFRAEFERRFDPAALAALLDR